MKKASEYRKHAEECRALARGVLDGPQKDQLLEMAATWDNLASERAAFIQRHPEQALPHENAEERARTVPSSSNE